MRRQCRPTSCSTTARSPRLPRHDPRACRRWRASAASGRESSNATALRSWTSSPRRMRAEDLRAVLLVKAVEEADRAGTLLAPADRASAARAARREHRESNDPHALLAARSHRLLERLARRERAVAHALALARGSRWIGFALIGLAAASGFALSALDGTQRINILGFSVLGLVLWNLAAYALLIMRPS